jgi:hypothetical protein
MEEEKKRGGARPNAGRKPVAEEQKVNSLFIEALKEMYKKDTDDEAKKTFVKDTLMESQRGQLFIAEHIFGKPKETVDQNVNINNFDLKDIIKFK